MSALQNLIRWFVPDESRFFDHIIAVADTGARSAQQFHELAHATEHAKRLALIEAIQETEHEGDRALRTISEQLDATFVTPIDREDLYHLAAALERISDFVYATANHLTVHHMETLPAGTVELADILVASAQRCVDACKHLRSGYKADEIRAACRDLERLEHEADVVFRLRLGDLFEREKDAITLIKHKEFLEGLEDAVDRCANVATVLEAILIKNA